MFNTLDVIALIIGGIGVVGSLYFRFKPAVGTSAADNAKERERETCSLLDFPRPGRVKHFADSDLSI